MEQYSLLGRIGEGAHGVVLKAKHIESGEILALKRVALKKIEDGIPNAVFREIKALQEIDSDHVVKLLDVFPQGSGFVLAFEFMVSDLSEVLRPTQPRLLAEQTKSFARMLLDGMAHCHQLGIIHRDLKPANLLVSHRGCLKVADFGLARVKDEDGRPYSHQVATRWYRAPELLYGARDYDEGVDLWAIGCIFGEMLNHSPLFPGENDIGQLCTVLRALGSPSESNWPGVTSLPDYNKITFAEMQRVPIADIVPDAEEEAVDLLGLFLLYSSSERISARQALKHDFFFLPPLPCHASRLPRPERTRAMRRPHVDFMNKRPVP